MGLEPDLDCTYRKSRLGNKAYFEVVDKAPDDFWRVLPGWQWGGGHGKSDSEEMGMIFLILLPRESLFLRM